MRVEFKRQVSLDTVIAAVALIIAIVTYASGIRSDIAELRVKVDAMWGVYTKGTR